MRKKIFAFIISLIIVLTTVFTAGCAGPKEFTVTFDPGAPDAYCYMGEVVQVVESADQLVEPVFVRPGYNFVGWNDNIWGIRGDKTIKALWLQYKIDVTFKGSGGVDSQGRGTVTVQTDSGATLVPPTFIKEGYDLSWDVDLFTITEACTVNAVWTPKEYAISFADADGTALAFDEVKVKYKSEISGLPTLEDRVEGDRIYRFSRWEVKGEEGSPNVPLTDGTIWNYTSNLTVYARWTTDEYLIDYDLQGGDAINNPATYSEQDQTITINNPTKKGYEFDGWTGTDLVEKTKDLTIPQGSIGDRAYKAHWKAKVYTVTLDALGGTFDTGVSNKVSLTYNEAIGELPTPTKDGYLFCYWKKANNNEEVTKDTIWDVDSAIDIVAEYKRIYTVKFDLSALVRDPITNKKKYVECKLTNKEDIEISIGQTLEDVSLTIIEDQTLLDIDILKLPVVELLNERDREEHGYSGYWEFIVTQSVAHRIYIDTKFNETNFPGTMESGIIVLNPHCKTFYSPDF